MRVKIINNTKDSIDLLSSGTGRVLGSYAGPWSGR